MDLVDRIEACLLGIALGDSLGLPFEGLGRRRIKRLGALPLRQRLVAGRGTVSDDTDHAELTLRAWCESDGDVGRFAEALARGLRRWFLALPPGIGMATTKACLRLCAGVGSARSGVHSAGNGPLMRATVIGLLPVSDDLMRELCDASTRITHTDDRAVAWARVIANVTRAFASGMSLEHVKIFGLCGVEHRDVGQSFIAAMESACHSEPTAVFAARIGCGERVSGFVMHTGPITVHAALSHKDSVLEAIGACIACGGDTDTTASIAGGIVGARHGIDQAGEKLLDRIVDWPRGITKLRRVSRATTAGVKPESTSFFLAATFRNFVMLVVVLWHAGRRLFPPW